MYSGIFKVWIIVSIGLINSKLSSAFYDLTNSICRDYARPCTKKIMPLIVGGSEADQKEFPHMALIGFGENNDLQWECGGALISKNFVLSAAHCADSREFGPAKKVKLGLIKRDEKGKHVQEKSIKRVINHPEYKRPLKYHDIALFELESDVDLTEFVWPACLNTVEEISGILPSAIGFGKTKFTNEKGNEKLKKVNLPVIENSICQPFYASMRVSTLPNGGLINSQICAGTLKGGQDTCQGDSGGPLQVYMDKPVCNYRIVGITSFGKFCGYAKSPAIYTNVYYYVPWIVETVWRNK